MDLHSLKFYSFSFTHLTKKTIVSPLKFQTRCVANFPNKTGFALGSVEGRVAIQVFHSVLFVSVVIVTF
jgi:mRNA export factor